GNRQRGQVLQARRGGEEAGRVQPGHGLGGGGLRLRRGGGGGAGARGGGHSRGKKGAGRPIVESRGFAPTSPITVIKSSASLLLASVLAAFALSTSAQQGSAAAPGPDAATPAAAAPAAQAPAATGKPDIA